MLQKALILAMMLFLGLAGIAAGECPKDVLELKAREYDKALTAAAAKDAEQANQVVLDSEEELARALSADDWDALCRYYDEMTRKMNEI